MPYTRRGFLHFSLAASPIVIALGGIAQWGATRSGAQELPLTPECVDSGDMTPAQTEGPFFTPNTPERASLLEPDTAGIRLIVSGFVLTQRCQPVAGALLDFWQADDRGAYDNSGFRLRGHQFADAEGRYRLETVLPGLYPGRTRHIHVKVQPSGGRLLTSQLYFAGEPANQRDGIFNSRLAMNVQDAEDGSKLARFDFVVAG